MNQLAKDQTCVERNESPLMNYVFFGGDFIFKKQARLSVASHSVQYGSSLFGGMRGFFVDEAIHLFRIKEQYKRLSDGAKILGFDFRLDFEVFLKTVYELIRLNHPQCDVYLRPVIYCDDEVLPPNFAGLKFHWALYMIALDQYLDTSKGLNLMISSWRKFSDAAISTKAKASGAYLNSSLARSDATRLGFDEALMTDESGHVVEGSAENIGIMYQGNFYTPPKGSSILDGITMRSAIEILREEKVHVNHTPIDRSMVYSCDELILTGTAATVAFADRVDGRVIGEQYQSGPGPITQLLKEKFNQVITLNHPLSQKWVTRVELEKGKKS